MLFTSSNISGDDSLGHSTTSGSDETGNLVWADDFLTMILRNTRNQFLFKV